jgi:membrane fusion protein, heavy metal efflux system
VHAQAGEAISGIVLPKSAVVRSANGEDIVWRHTDPERFVPAPVRISPFDGARVLVQAGLGQGQRIVVQGAELISQVR